MLVKTNDARGNKIADWKNLTLDGKNDPTISVDELFDRLGFSEEDKLQSYIEHAELSQAIGLKGLRLNKGLTQAQAARAVGVPQPRWSEWENGKHKPKDYYMQLRNALGVSQEELEVAIEETVKK